MSIPQEIQELVLEGRRPEARAAVARALQAGARDEMLILLAAAMLERADEKITTKPSSRRHHAFEIAREERKLRKQGLSAEEARERLADESVKRGWGVMSAVTIKRRVNWVSWWEETMRQCEQAWNEGRGSDEMALERELSAFDEEERA